MGLGDWIQVTVRVYCVYGSPSFQALVSSEHFRRSSENLFRLLGLVLQDLHSQIWVRGFRFKAIMH